MLGPGRPFLFQMVGVIRGFRSGLAAVNQAFDDGGRLHYYVNHVSPRQSG